MMKQTMDEFDPAGSRMADDTRTVIADGNRVLAAAVDASGERFEAAQGKLTERFANASAKLADASRTTIAKTRETAAAADAYVRRSPWEAVGVAAAAGALIGVLIGVLVARR